MQTTEVQINQAESLRQDVTVTLGEKINASGPQYFVDRDLKGIRLRGTYYEFSDAENAFRADVRYHIVEGKM